MAAHHRFSQRSLAALEGVHPDLVRVAHRALALTDQDFTITEGLRTLDRQRELVAAGKSKTMRSRHLTGHAIDVVAYVAPGVLTYQGKRMRVVTDAFRAAASSLRIPITLGIDWGWDSPHVELDRKIYP